MAILAPLLAGLLGGGGAGAAAGTGAATGGAADLGAVTGAGMSAVGPSTALSAPEASLMFPSSSAGTTALAGTNPMAGSTFGIGGGTPNIMQLLMQSQQSQGRGDPSKGWSPMPQLGGSAMPAAGSAPQMSPLTMRLLQQYMQQLMPQGGGFQWPGQ